MRGVVGEVFLVIWQTNFLKDVTGVVVDECRVELETTIIIIPLPRTPVGPQSHWHVP